MGSVRPETKDKKRTDRPTALVLKKLCQWSGSAVRSLILTTAGLQQQRVLTVKQQVSTFEARGVSSMF